MSKIGTGYITVDADLAPFWRRVEREMAGLDGAFKKGGRSAGDSFAKGSPAAGSRIGTRLRRRADPGCPRLQPALNRRTVRGVNS